MSNETRITEAEEAPACVRVVQIVCGAAHHALYATMVTSAAGEGRETLALVGLIAFAHVAALIAGGELPARCPACAAPREAWCAYVTATAYRTADEARPAFEALAGEVKRHGAGEAGLLADILHRRSPLRG